nr:hypothetical protein [Tanacetum cinerariifolium]
MDKMLYGKVKEVFMVLHCTFYWLKEDIHFQGCYLRNMVMEIVVLDILNDALPITTNVNPHIYISCIKQFWNTAYVKRLDNVTRLQALVDRKKIVISEDVIREILQLDDAEGVVYLPNEEIFVGLAQMRYEKPSTKLTFYKAFFSSQWKFLIHTLLQSLSAKRTSWNEFSTTMASAENVVEDVANAAIPSPPSHDIPPPSQEQSLPPQQP